jgi:hypothetical protein
LRRLSGTTLLYVCVAVLTVACAIWVIVVLAGGLDAVDTATVLGLLATAVALLLTIQYRRQDQLVVNDENLALAKQRIRDRVFEDQDTTRHGFVDKTRLFETEFELVDSPMQRYDGLPVISSITGIGAFFGTTENHRLLILGSRGSGKSVLVLQLVDQILQDRSRTIEAVPVPINASRWRSSSRFDSWLAEEISQEYQLPGPLSEGLVRRRQIIPVLDGLDELGRTPGDNEYARAQELIQALNEYTLGGRLSPLIASSRTDYYEGATAWDVDLTLDAVTVRVLPLTGTKVHNYIETNISDESWRPVLDALGGSEAPILASRFGEPLWLSLAINAGRKKLISPSALITSFGEDLEKTLLEAHLADLFRSMRFRALASYNSPDDLQRWFSNLASYLTRNESQHLVGDRVLSASGVVPHEIWPIAGVRRVRNTDFALSLLISAPGLVWIGFLLLDRSRWYLSVLIPFYGLYLAALARTSRKFWISPKFFVVRRLFGRSAVAQAILSTIGAVIALRIFDWTVAIVAAASIWVMSGLSIGISQTLVTPPRRTAGPDAPLLGERTISLVSGLAGGPALALVAWRTSCLIGLVLAIGYAGLVGLTVASAPWRRYVSFVACKGKVLPIRTLALLREGYESGLLRISGLEYQFRHVELQRQLTGTASLVDRGR